MLIVRLHLVILNRVTKKFLQENTSYKSLFKKIKKETVYMQLKHFD